MFSGVDMLRLGAEKGESWDGESPEGCSRGCRGQWEIHAHPQEHQSSAGEVEAVMETQQKQPELCGVLEPSH